ncbi:uncharacterized protein BDZ83DRAFT_640382, partial [Colletotrichum acutatum]
MTADVLDYEHLRGRSYHSDIFSSTYWAPNDELQSEAMGLWSGQSKTCDPGHHDA